MTKFQYSLCLITMCASINGTLTASELSNKEVEKITAYFNGYIAGDNETFSSNKTIKPSNVADIQNAVWNIWKNAVTNYDNEHLPPLQQISPEATGHMWNIPDSLEPNASMPFYWVAKSNGAPEAKLPMFIYLHGSGPKAQEWATGLILAQRFDDAPSAYFIPQIPNEGEYYRWWQKGKQFIWNQLLQQTLASDEIDANRIYLFGISEGGYGSQRLASFYADYLAGAGPMAGGEPLKNAPIENLRNTAFSLRTGDKDFGFYRNKLTGYVKRSLDSIKAVHPNEFNHYTVELIPDRGHSIDYSPTTPWLKQFIRNPYPRHISWENFEMDGQYRSGFYNLKVNRRSNADESSRTNYEMDIDNNAIDFRIDEVRYSTIETDPQWGIALDFKRSYTPASTGSITIYLNDQLVDLNKPVTLTVNGRKVFNGKVKCKLENIVNSCATFFDPARLYPASITVDL